MAGSLWYGGIKGRHKALPMNLIEHTHYWSAIMIFTTNLPTMMVASGDSCCSSVGE
jgi:hypothetical protein